MDTSTIRAVALGSEAAALKQTLEQTLPPEAPLREVISRCVAAAEIGAVAASTSISSLVRLGPDPTLGVRND